MVHRPAGMRAAPAGCAVLLVLGALVLTFAPGTSAWWGLALAHGAAWSVAWAAQLHDRARRGSANGSALAGAALNALLVLALGLAIRLAGLSALTGWHLALGVAGGTALATWAALIYQPRKLLPR